MIVGQKINETEDTYILQRPFDTFVNVTGNVLEDS
jgi:hypothetical protein